MNAQELKNIYWSFFDQLKPEHAEKAKANYDEDYWADSEPSGHAESINYGFDWSESLEGHELWQDVFNRIEDKTYPLQLTPQVCKDKAKAHMGAELPATDEDRAGLEELVKEATTLPDSGDRSEFDTGAVRDASNGKGLPSFIPTRALMRVSKRFEDGAGKYGVHNWRKGIPLSRYVDSLNRHLWAFMQGDTTEDHLGAITWNAMCLSETYDLISEGKLPDNLNDLPEHGS